MIDCELRCHYVGKSYYEILGILKDKGYSEVLSIYYKANGKFKELKNDESTMEMIIKSTVNGIMNLYVLTKRVKSTNLHSEKINADHVEV